MTRNIFYLLRNNCYVIDNKDIPYENKNIFIKIISLYNTFFKNIIVC